MKKFIVTVVLSLIAGSPALAQNATFRCLPVKEAAGKGAVELLKQKLVSSLTTELGWKDPVITIRSLRLERNSTVTREVAKGRYFLNSSISEVSGATPQLSFSADLGANIDSPLCKVKVLKAKATVAGTYTKDGKDVVVKKLPINLDNLTVPGLLVPAAPSAAAAH